MKTSLKTILSASIVAFLVMLNADAACPLNSIFAGQNGTDTRDGKLIKFKFSGAYNKRSATGINYPIAFAISPEGDLFVGGGEVIVEFTNSGPTTFATGLQLPGGLVFDGAGNLYESEQGTGEILKFTPDGARTTFASGLFIPAGLAVDLSGNLYAADTVIGSIYKYDPDGNRSVFAANLTDAFGLAFDQSGNLFVGQRGPGSIVKITPNGVVRPFVDVNQPFGLAFDAAGNLYAASLGDATIVKITPAGVKSIFASVTNLAAGLAIRDR